MGSVHNKYDPEAVVFSDECEELTKIARYLPVCVLCWCFKTTT